MASALVAGLLKKGREPHDIRVLEIDVGARQRLAEELGVMATDQADAALAGAECVVFAVKPQQMQAIARALAGHVGSMLVITIAAGIRVADLARWLGSHRRIVRAMPNTPALTLAGVTGLYAPAAVTAEDRARAELILGAAGTTLWVEDEREMDAITAVSGSGPAYVFYFLEALERAAIALGFDAARARTLALETFTGAVKLAREADVDVETLRARVTSRGGTTERAIAALESAGVREAIVDAVIQADERAQELGTELGRDAGGGRI